MRSKLYHVGLGFRAVGSVVLGATVGSAEQAAGTSYYGQTQGGTAPAGNQQGAEPLVIFDFEGGNLQEWMIPDWAKDSEEDVGKVLSATEEVASHGTGSTQLLADFPGGKWTGAYIEVLMHVTDWTPFGTMAMDVYVPPNAPNGLQSRFILTIGDKWEWTEMNHPTNLEPGKWTTVMANLKPGSLDWKFFPTESFRKDIRKVGIRVESNKEPAYSGPIYFDNLRLGP